MWPVSANFSAQISGTHQMVAAATIGTHGTEGVDITPYLTGGSVTVDRRRAVRRTCTIEVTDPTGGLIPDASSDALHPGAGQILKLYRGIKWTAGEEPSNWWLNHSAWFSSKLWLPNGGTLSPALTELVPLGWFRITDTTIKESGAGVTMTIEGADFSWVVQRALFVEPFAVTSGTTVSDAIDAILNDRVPQYEKAITGSLFELPTLAWGLGSEATTDPWTVCQNLADDAGVDIFWDQVGVARTKPTPTAGTIPALTYADGDVEVILSTDRALDGDTLYNGVVVTAEGSNLATPIRTELWDEVADSPTRKDGPFGNIPEIYSSPRILTLAQAETAAAERLQRNLGIGASLAWDQVVNPVLDAGDVIRVTRPDISVDDDFVIDSITIPLIASGSSSASARTLASAS